MLTAHDAAKGFDAVGAPARVEVLLTLVRAGPDGLLIGELQRRLEIPCRGDAITPRARRS
jgi:hypothetical protein